MATRPIRPDLRPWLAAPAILLSTTLATAEDAVCYHANGEQGEIRIAFEIDGAGFSGRFRDFEAEYCMPGDDPEAGTIRVTVDIGSVATGNRDLDIGMQERDGLAVDDHPQARWETTRIHQQNDTYHIEGQMTLRGETRHESGRFQLAPEGDGWRLTGDSTVNRLDYGVGTGEFRDTEFIPDPVRVTFDLHFR